MKLNRVSWKRKKYLLVGDLESGGAIATKQEYQSGQLSTAHLRADGTIWQFGERVGTRNDLKLLKPINAPKPSGAAFMRVFDRMFPSSGIWL